MKREPIAFIDSGLLCLSTGRLSADDVGREFLAALELAQAGAEITRGPFVGLYIRYRRTGVLSPATRARIMARDGLICRYCHTTEGPWDIDHIHPVARGGGDEDENLCVACATCNRRKGARLDFA